MEELKEMLEKHLELLTNIEFKSGTNLNTELLVITGQSIKVTALTLALISGMSSAD